MTGRISPFARPLIVHVVLFVIVVIVLFVYRRFFVPESALLLTAVRYWAMLSFAAIPFVLALGEIAAAWEARRLSPEEPWKDVDLLATIEKRASREILKEETSSRL